MLVHAGLAGVLDLGRKSQAPFLPLGLPGEGLLLLVDVYTGCVDFIVAAGLEDVEDLAKLVDVGDPSSGLFVGSKGH
jgi:hypothetical protein